MSNKKPHIFRLPQEFIDKIIDRVDIVDVIGKRIKLNKAGKDYAAKCPFHKENSPSFTVSPEKQFCYCFGCGYGGNALEFIVEYDKLDFLTVIKSLADENGFDITPYLHESNKAQNSLKLEPAIHEAADIMSSALRGPEGKAGMDYLKSRHLTAEIIEAFQIGFAGYGKKLVELLQHHAEPLVEAGVFDVADNGDIRSSFWKRVMLPIRDNKGRFIGLSGRTIDPDAKPKYKNSKESAIFQKTNVLYGLYEATQMIGGNKIPTLYVNEGQFDVIANQMVKIPACATMGSSLSLQQLRLLLRFAEKVVFVFDGDAAGLKALKQTGELLLENLSDPEVIFEFCLLPEGKDPHEMVTTDLEDYKSTINKTIPWMDALLDHMPEIEGLNTDERGRTLYVTAALNLVHDCIDPLTRHNFLVKLESKSGVPMDVLKQKLESFPVHRSGSREAGKAILNDAPIRLARMLWDSPKLSDSIVNLDLWKSDTNDLISMIGMWVEEMRKGTYDLPFTDAHYDLLREHPTADKHVDAERRYKGATAAFGRLTALLPREVTQSLMAEAPDESKGIAFSLIMNITSTIAQREIQALTSLAGLGMLDEQGRLRFTELMQIRNDALKRGK